MNFEKLKETARKYEQKEEWRRAIEVYLQAIREFEAGNDPVPDLSVYNRIGDLYLKANEPGPAVQAYERAADLYGEQGFYNNAIALCGKILRVNPGRIGTYLKLAHLHARKNVVIEAKKNLLEYLERMNALNQLDDAFKSVKEFADQFPGNKEIRLMLSELLRASSRNAEAREQLEKLANDLEARGDSVGARKTLARLQALDAEDGSAPAEGAAPRQPPPRTKGDLIFLDTGAEFAPPAPRSSSAPSARKTRAVVMPPPGRATERVRAPGGIPLIEVGDDKARASGPRAAEPPAAPLKIEHSSLIEPPLDLEAVQPITEEAELEAAAAADVAKTLGFEPTVTELDAGAVAPMEGLELDVPAEDNVDLQVSTEGLDLERASVDPAELEPGERTSLIIPEPLESTPELAEALDQLAGDDTASEPAGDIGGELELLDTGAAEPEFFNEPELDYPTGDLPSVGDTTEGGDVTFIEPGPAVELTISDLEDRVLDDPEDPEAHRALGEALLAAGEQLRGQEELELALAGYEGKEDWVHASDLINELIRLDPNGVRYHQKRVEIGFRSGDRSRLVESYLELADALLRVGAMDKALAVYRRVSEHDPGNQRALAALDAFSSPEDELPPIPPLPAAQPPAAGLTRVAEEADHAVDAMFEAPAEAPPPPSRAPAPPPGPSAAPQTPPAEPRQRKAVPAARLPEPSGDFIDLGALVLDDDRIKDTRMRVEDEEPTGDEQKDFNEMLTAFRRGIDENIDAEDFQAHYDLGVAFKEMGLLDEAIAEFQKALRSPEGRLKTSEALGTAFFDKAQFAIAEAILKRAVESLGATDDEQIGLIYWLGRAQEAQGKTDASIGSYQRVLAVDIGFQDVTFRMNRLASGRVE